MRNLKESAVERFRIVKGRFATPPGAQHGVFLIPLIEHPTPADLKRPSVMAKCFVDDGGKTNWEQVKVLIQDRRKKKGVDRWPGVTELQAIKQLFFLDGETACMFFHSESDKEFLKFPMAVTIWKPRGAKVSTPPPDLLT